MTDNTDERLARIEVMLQQLTATVDQRVVQSDRWRTRIEKTIYGDGNGNPGHHIKLDRLLQAQDRQKWLIRAVVGSVVALAAQAILGGLTG